MKKSTIVLIAGGAVIAGAVAYGVYKYLQKKDDVIAQENSDKDPDISIAPEVPHTDDIVAEFEKTQQETVDSIRAHHKEAAEQLETTLNEMAVDCAAFEEKTVQANEALDELLK